jgi:hypothetical protein
MKRTVLTAAAAICIACGVSAHKMDQTNRFIHWLKWLIRKLRNAPLLPIDNSGLFHPAYGTTPAGTYPANPCSGGTYWCLAGFTTAQLTAGGNYLKTILGNQTPVTAAYTMN